MILFQDVGEMSREQMAALVQEYLVGRQVSIPLKDQREPVLGMRPWPYPDRGMVTALREDLVWGLIVLVEAPGFAVCCFQAAWALEYLTVMSE